MRGGKEDEYARKPVLGRSQQAFETSIKQCLQEGGFSHQVQGTVISQLARKLQEMEEQYAPPNIEEAIPKNVSQPQPDLSSFVTETKHILDQFQRTFTQNKDDFINQQKTLNLNSTFEQMTEFLKIMEQNLTNQIKELEKTLLKKMDEKLSNLTENPINT